ncbi:MAG: hypothetical protein GC191_18145 [Azospirillum sp.]|nr:hypothetical protein [Azospirillum sp.]
MIRLSLPNPGRAKGTAAVSVALLAAACAPLHSPPEQVRATNPSVTYKYLGDQELLVANQKAMAYCSGYNSTPQTLSITESADGSKTVVFECIATTPILTTARTYNSNLVYSYRTDQDLLDASRNAQIYCLNNGWQGAVSTGVTHANGSGTASFRCTGR